MGSCLALCRHLIRGEARNRAMNGMRNPSGSCSDMMVTGSRKQVVRQLVRPIAARSVDE